VSKKQIDTLSEQQLADRRLGIGGSDVGAILGLSPWKSPLDVYYEKIGEAGPSMASERMYWGQRLEAVVAEEYCARHQRQVRRKKQTIVDKRRPWMRANIDRIVLRLDRLLECKTTGERNADQWGEPGSDQIPTLYMAQCQHYLVVTELPAIDVAVLIGGQEYRDYTVESDPEIRDMLIEEEHRFWHEHVEARVPPAPRSVEEAARLWPRHSDASAIATPEVEDACRRLAEIKAAKSELEREEKERKLEVEQAMGEAGVLLDADGRRTLAAWKHEQRSSIDTKALKSEQPEIAERYQRTTDMRRFLLKT